MRQLLLPVPASIVTLLPFLWITPAVAEDAALIEPSTWTIKGKRNSNIGFGDFRMGPYTVENISGFANSGETKWSVGGFGRNSQDHQDEIAFDLHQSGQPAASMRCSRDLRDSGFNIGDGDGFEIGGISGEKSAVLNCEASPATADGWTIQLASNKASPGFRGILRNGSESLALQPVPGSESTFTSSRSYRITRQGADVALIKRTVAGGAVTIESPITEAEQAVIGAAATLLLLQKE